MIIKALEESHILYDIFEDTDGYLIFPKGARALDTALISEPLQWLKTYPIAQKEWIDALKQYSNADEVNASDIADKFRKALERFFQEFFESKKSLKNLKSENGFFCLKKRPSRIKK